MKKNTFLKKLTFFVFLTLFGSIVFEQKTQALRYETQQKLVWRGSWIPGLIATLAAIATPDRFYPDYRKYNTVKGGPKSFTVLVLAVLTTYSPALVYRWTYSKTPVSKFEKALYDKFPYLNNPFATPSIAHLDSINYLLGAAFYGTNPSIETVRKTASLIYGYSQFPLVEACYDLSKLLNEFKVILELFEDVKEDMGITDSFVQKFEKFIRMIYMLTNKRISEISDCNPEFDKQFTEFQNCKKKLEAAKAENLNNNKIFDDNDFISDSENENYKKNAIQKLKNNSNAPYEDSTLNQSDVNQNETEEKQQTQEQQIVQPKLSLLRRLLNKLSIRRRNEEPAQNTSIENNENLNKNNEPENASNKEENPETLENNNLLDSDKE